MDNDLTLLAKHYGTDKYQHGYMPFYQKYFETLGLTGKEITMMELGIYKGASLKMWSHFLPRATIHGIDNGRLVTAEEMEAMETDKVSTFIADQKDRESLSRVVEDQSYDVIIDDGHHFMDTQQVSLGYLFPYLKPGGVFVIEDLHPVDQGFGQRDHVNNSDATLEVLAALKENRPIVTPHLLAHEVEYLRANIGHMYVREINRESIIAFIIKRSAARTTKAA